MCCHGRHDVQCSAGSNWLHVTKKFALKSSVLWNRHFFLLIDDEPDYLIAFQVRVVPTVVGVKDGEAIERFEGVLQDNELKAFLEKLLWWMQMILPALTSCNPNCCVDESQICSLYISAKEAQPQSFYLYRLSASQQASDGILSLSILSILRHLQTGRSPP